MIRTIVALLLPLCLSACFSYSETPPPPASHTTLVVPPGSTVTCANGAVPPC